MSYNTAFTEENRQRMIRENDAILRQLHEERQSTYSAFRDEEEHRALVAQIEQQERERAAATMDKARQEATNVTMARIAAHEAFENRILIVLHEVRAKATADSAYLDKMEEELGITAR